jgi:Lar family restriction alleviation protein
MDNLKECPFCESNNIKVRDDPNFVYYGGAYYIECQECEACSGTVRTVEEAAAAWNRRPNA